MPNNNIELITTYSSKYWDVVYKQEAVTSILDADPAYVKFTGAKTVKIGKWQSGGLHNYYRNNIGDARAVGNPNQPGYAGVKGESGAWTLPPANFAGAADFGYQKSATRLTWEEFTLRCDRGAAFEIELFDNEESGD